jgi:(1->4)-alpha-D-glucan 1-alpha-D-glucosylmutase
VRREKAPRAKPCIPRDQKDCGELPEKPRVRDAAIWAANNCAPESLAETNGTSSPSAKLSMQIPLATYRVQFNANFRFADAEKLVPYLQALGISHLYASPLLQARRGSLHGYDVTDPTRLSSDLGSEDDFARLTERMHQHAIGLLLDIVPNHMAASQENRWWMDVLEHGEDSEYASYFDIDWQSSGSKFPLSQKGRMVLPVLSDFYERLLSDQRIVLRFEENGFYIEAEGNTLPVNPKTYGGILEPCLELLRRSERADEEAVRRAEGLLSSLRVFRTHKDAKCLKSELWDLHQRDHAFHSALEQTIQTFNGTKGNPASFALLNALLSSQAYRLAFWRNAVEEVNYRRFFGLNELVALRMEHPPAFNNSHARIFEMVAQGKVNGLRIDHIDGLRDPLAYLQQLQSVRTRGGREDSDALQIYTIVEKITSGRETLPVEWPTAGTTGYDYLNAVNTLFIDPVGSRELEATYRGFSGIRSSFAETWNIRKKQVMEEMFTSDIRRLSWRLGRLATLDRLGSDVPMRELIRGLKEVTASLPIYRTYCRDLCLPERDRFYIQKAFEIARERAPLSALSDAAFEFLQSVFLLRPSFDLPNHRDEWLDFLLSWQQFTGAVMAKGLEDTAFFVHHGLISLNEVGCNPLRKEIGFGITAFHRQNQRILAEHPFTLNATSTHDTKWSEDLRARINVLSEMPAEWKARLDRWSQWNQPRKSEIGGRVAPSPNEEVLLYQSMLGIWPADAKLDDIVRGELCNRLQQFILKAAREGKTHSSWVSPNEAHENAMRRFVCSILDDKSENPFLSDFSDFVERISPAGACNAYAQVLLKITSPGIPDFFQGNELWNFCLTDPDNRNKVDFDERLRLLKELEETSAGSQPLDTAELLNRWKDGRLKLYLTRQALNFRRAHPNLFLKGEYVPLEAAGEQRNSACTFARRYEGTWALVATPRLTARLARDGTFPLGQISWGSTTIPLSSAAPANWENVFTGEGLSVSWEGRKKTLRLASVFSQLPFALLRSAA